MIPDATLEKEIILNLLHELTSVEDFDNNDSIYMREFTFFDYANDHVLNAYRFNMDSYTDVDSRIDRFTISFFDYAKWYWETFHNSNQSNNPCNYTRYYCSKNTGPAWKACRDVAALSIGSYYEEERGPALCRVEKIGDHLLKYTEKHNGFPVHLNYGAGTIYWEFRYETV